MRVWTLVLTLLMGLGMANGQKDKDVREKEKESGAAKALHDLFAAEWDYRMQQEPDFASELGDRRWNDRWPDDSLEAFARRSQHNQDVLARLAKIDRNGLAPADQLNYDLF